LALILPFIKFYTIFKEMAIKVLSKNKESIIGGERERETGVGKI
jgi:hypothetical protein